MPARPGPVHSGGRSYGPDVIGEPRPFGQVERRRIGIPQQLFQVGRWLWRLAVPEARVTITISGGEP